MSWRSVDFIQEVEEFKKKTGKIPSETCPDIDTIIKMLEELRSDNAKLRELGRDWHEKCCEIAEEAEKALDKKDKEIAELEREVSNLEEEIKELKNL